MTVEELEDAGYQYSGEVFINSSVEYAAREAQRRVDALRKDGYEATFIATVNLGGWHRGFAVYYREKQA